MNEEALELHQLHHLVIDEADLILSYGYEDDTRSLASALPSGVQTIMMSATLRTDVDTLSSIFCRNSSSPPAILDLSAEEATERPTLAQYIVRTAEEDKFLLVYAFFKLQLVKGKVIVFVADVDRAYRLKLFLEQFGIRSCVLNSELPVNSRLHAVDQFNKGVYDIIIAADEMELVGKEDRRQSKRRRLGDEETAEEDKKEGLQDEEVNNHAHENAELQDEGDGVSKEDVKRPRPHNRNQDPEYGVSRGLDFRSVSCILNFDLPTSAKSYAHRIGRTARAGQTGTAVSFYIPKDLYGKHRGTSIAQCQKDEAVLARIRRKQEEKGTKVEEWNFDMSKLEGFRYRLGSALKNVTRIAVREARTKELRTELINSTKLKRHFEENPEDLRHLRHDGETHVVRQQPHLKHVPDYLLPQGRKRAVAEDVGFVSMRKEGGRRGRTVGKRSAQSKARAHRGGGMDPLRSLNTRGRAKK